MISARHSLHPGPVAVGRPCVLARASSSRPPQKTLTRRAVIRHYKADNDTTAAATDTETAPEKVQRSSSSSPSLQKLRTQVDEIASK